LDKDKVKKLIDYIIIELLNEEDYNKVHRYPYMACEVLNCDVPKINNFLFSTNKELYSNNNQSSFKISIMDNLYDTEGVQSINEDDFLSNDNGIIQSINQEDNFDKAETISIDANIDNIIEIENENRIEMLDYLLKFLDTDKELNYVLVSYFAKFFSLLLNKRLDKVNYYIKYNKYLVY
jgi:hypothetical protein